LDRLRRWREKWDRADEAIASPDVLRLMTAATPVALATPRTSEEFSPIDRLRPRLHRRDYSLSRVMDKKTRDISLVALVTAIGVVAVSNTGVYSVAGDAPDSFVRSGAGAHRMWPRRCRSDGIGIVREHVTTASSEAGAFYNQGVAYLHSFVWIEAARSFNQALRLDPNLAMADRTPVRAWRAWLVLRQRAAMCVLNGWCHWFRHGSNWIELRKEQLDAAAEPDRSSRAYQQTSASCAAYPDAVELLLIIGQAQDSSHDGHGMNVGSASLPFYLRALATSPDYFATHHFLTHAYENTREFDRALVHAERYARMASAVPHAHHMYGHVLRRVNRMPDAITEFEQADRLETAYLRSEAIPPRYDWHYRHNLSLLGSSYQYVGRTAAADAVLRRSFELDGATPSDVDLDRKQWVLSLLAARRPADALTAARSLVARPQPLFRALGHLLAGRAQLALNRPDDAAKEGNLGLGEMRAAGPSGGVLVPEYELLQGEYLLRTGQVDRGRAMLRSAAAKLREASGPDAWVTTLFSLEAIVRSASDLGDWPVVQDYAQQMQELDAAYPGTQYVLGLLAEHDGHRDAALAFYQTAVGSWAGADADFSGRRDLRARIAGLNAGTVAPRRP
jgi:tetratricopeptide (TPR) repeat protein